MEMTSEQYLIAEKLLRGVANQNIISQLRFVRTNFGMFFTLTNEGVNYLYYFFFKYEIMMIRKRELQFNNLCSVGFRNVGKFRTN